MGKARDNIPALRFGGKIYPEDIAGLVGNPWANYWYVDADNGSDSANNGSAVDKPTASIEQAITNAAAGDVVIVRPRAHTDYTGDPVSYEENITIPYAKSGLTLIGAGNGLTQGNLPQLKDGATTTQHILRVRAPGCLITGLGFNGTGNTGGGILLDDDYTAKAAFGTTISGCHFKNCVGTTANNAATGGAINWSSAGNSWQVRIQGNRFYKCVGDVVLPGTTNTVPQDVVIQDNIFSGPASATDCNLYLQGAGSGMNGVVIDSNVFQQLPALGGTNDRYIIATGCVGMMTRNFFGCEVCAGGTQLTFEAAGTGAMIPLTLHMAGNYGQFITGTGAGLESGEIYA